MLKELTSRGILFICLPKGRSCTYLDAKIDIELKKFKFNKPGEIQVHQSSQSKQTSASKIVLHVRYVWDSYYTHWDISMV